MPPPAGWTEREARPAPAPSLPSAEARRRRSSARCCLHPRAHRLCRETEEASAPARTGQATAAAAGGEDGAARGGRTGEIKATRRRSPDLGTRTASARSADLGVARLCRASMRGEGAPPSLALGWLDLCRGRDRRPPPHQVARFGHDGGAEAAAPPPPIPSGWPASAPRHLLRRRAAMGSRVGAGQGCRHARVGGVGERKRGGRRRG
jgi:hypothetical protein